MRKIFLATAVLGLLFMNAAPAQPPEKPKAEQTREKPAAKSNMRELFEQVMIARLSKDLEFSDEETVLLVRRFIEFRDAVQIRRRERERAVRALERAVAQEKTDHIDKLLADVMAFDEQLASAKRRMYEHVSEGLAPEKKAKLYLWLRDFESDMRRLLQQARKDSENTIPKPPQK